MRYSILLFILLVVLWASLAGTTDACRSDARGFCVDTASVGFAAIPGLEFLPFSGGDFGDLLIALYRFGLSIVGISALMMVLYGGVLYMTAGDNQGRLGKAKTSMGNALFGLVLALVAYLILFTINPDLVKKLKMQLPKLSYGTGQVENLSSIAALEDIQKCEEENGSVESMHGRVVCVEKFAQEHQRLGWNEKKGCESLGASIVALGSEEYCSRPFK